jgi:hypothetical protein
MLYYNYRKEREVYKMDTNRLWKRIETLQNEVIEMEDEKRDLILHAENLDEIRVKLNDLTAQIMWNQGAIYALREVIKEA